MYGPNPQARDRNDPWQPSYVLHVNMNNAMSSLLRPPMTTQMDALFSYDIESYQEFLLCFSKFGLYVTYDGKRSRQSEIMWPSQVKE